MSELRGGEEFAAALRTQIVAARAVADTATREASDEVGRWVTDELMLKEHAKSTPTPSSPGEPPAMISGHLKASVTVEPVRPIGADRFEARVGPTAVYARIQELGGETGRGHATRLPARPYMRSARRKAKPRVLAIFRAAFSALGRGL